MTSGKVATTIGFERRNNPALRFTDREAFVAFMTADQPARPANLANIVAINQGRRPLTMDDPAPRPLTPHAVAELLAAGHVAIDARRAPEFAAGHVRGAVNVQLASPEFEQRVGWVAPPDAGLVLVLDRDEEAHAALRALAFVGLDARVAGHLAGGVAAWRAAGSPLDTLEQIDVRTLQRRLADREVRVLDVRERAEWNAGHVAGAQLMSYKHLASRAQDLRVHPDATLAVLCQSGGRSSTAASLLKRAGHRRVLNVAGGIQEWIAAGLPTERSGLAGPS